VLASSTVDGGFSSSGQTKEYNVASPLSTQHSGVRLVGSESE